MPCIQSLQHLGQFVAYTFARLVERTLQSTFVFILREVIVSRNNLFQKLHVVVADTSQSLSQLKSHHVAIALENGATLENCFTNVNSTATERGWVGGFIGLIDKPNSIVTIKNCVSVGNQSSIGRDKFTNSFIGGNNAGDTPNAAVTFTGNLYSLEAINDAETAWPLKNQTAEGGNVEDATGLHNTELCTQAPYADITWDFNEVWAIPSWEFPSAAHISGESGKKKATTTRQ